MAKNPVAEQAKRKKLLSPATPAPKGENRGATYKANVERGSSMSKAVSKASRSDVPRSKRGG